MNKIFQISVIMLASFLLYYTDAVASTWCAITLNIPVSDTSYNKILREVNARNRETTWNHIFSNKIFWVSFLDFGDSRYSLFQWVLQFWDWKVWGFGDGWPCYYPQRRYQITREKQLSLQDQINVLKDNARYNLYADENSPALPLGTFFGGTEIYETGTINDLKYVVTYSISEFEWTSSYSLWLIWKKYNYLFWAPGTTEYEDVKRWKDIIETLQL